MTPHNFLIQYKFVKHGNKGCNCGPMGQAKVYKRDISKTEVKLYQRKKKFKITQPGRGDVTGTFSELERTLQRFIMIRR